MVRIEIIDTGINHDKGKFGDNLEEFRRRHNIAELGIDPYASSNLELLGLLI